MLKIKYNSKFDEIVNNYNLDYDSDSDYESGVCYAIYSKGGVIFDVSRCYNELKQDDIIQIYGIDNEELDILYDLIKDDMVEKVQD